VCNLEVVKAGLGMDNAGNKNQRRGGRAHGLDI
jgi:hypothetical protein